MAAKLYATCTALLLLILAMLGFGGGGGFGAGRNRADFAYVNQSGINTLDPAAMTWMQDFRVALNIWEGLTQYDPKVGEAVPAAATMPEASSDGLVYTFTIREDARWSNGDPVLAGDFVRGWRRAIEPGTAGDYAFLLTEHIEGASAYFEWRLSAVEAELADHAQAMDARFAKVGIRAVDDRRLELRLTAPCSYLADLLALPVFLPIHESIERLRVSCSDADRSGKIMLTEQGLVAYDPQWTKPDYREKGYQGLVTNGAYRIEDWQFKRRLRMVVNPYHRDVGRIECDTVDMVVYRNLNAAIMAYEAGDLDFLPDTAVSYTHELVRLGRVGERTDFVNPPVFGTYYYIFNCSAATYNDRVNPFTDARVRKAFALAIDRKLLVEQVLGRGDPPTHCLIPKGSIPGYTSPEGLNYAPDEARRLLADAGYPGGVGLPVIDLLYNTGFDHGKVCDVLGNMWARELGVVVSLRGKEVKTFAEDRKNGNFMIARAGWYGDYADPTTFLDVFAGDSGNNGGGYTSDAYDALLGRARVTADVRARFRILAEAEAMLVREDLPLIPLHQYTQLLAISPRVRGIVANDRLRFSFSQVHRPSASKDSQ